VSAAIAGAGWCIAVALLLELRRRASLVADAAHELRGPLTAISLGIDALRRQPVARQRAEALATELCRMQVAVEDATAAGRGRRATSKPVKLLVKPLIERSAAAWLPAAQRRGARVTLDWTGGGRSVEADPRRMAQAFGNLLANAVEHGGGEIVVRGRPWEGGIRVEVEDRGSGASASRHWRFGSRGRGRGRGLAIAARALEQAGGRLSSFDRPGGGRVAVAELPAERSG
jgi:signal transduction histidine kinase